MAMSNAERQRRYRARKRGEEVPRLPSGRARLAPSTLLELERERLRKWQVALEAERAELDRLRAELSQKPVSPVEALRQATQAVLSRPVGPAQAPMPVMVRPPDTPVPTPYGEWEPA